MTALGRQWPRVFEVLLGVALAVVPWLVDAPMGLRLHDAVAAIAILSITGWSMAQPERLVHLYNLVVAAWLSGFALLFSRTLHSAVAQSELLVGLTVALFAIIPSRTMEVPTAWREFFAANPQLAEEERRALASRRRTSS